MSRSRQTFPIDPIAQRLLGSPGFLLAWVADHLTDRYDAAMETLGLRTTHHSVLVCLSEDGPLRQAELERRLRVDHASFVTALNELEQRALVDRTRDETDRRTLLVTLTEAGLTLVDQTWNAISQIENATLKALNPTQRRELTTLLAIVVAELAADDPVHPATRRDGRPTLGGPGTHHGNMA